MESSTRAEPQVFNISIIYAIVAPCYQGIVEVPASRVMPYKVAYDVIGH